MPETIAIYRGPKRGYSLTDEDVLWLARGFVGEAGENCSRREAAALFHCWLDRFLLVNGRWLQEGWSFKALLRAHSQPLNPLWSDANSEKCQKSPKACTPELLARRAYIQGLSTSQLQGFGVYQFALEAQVGTLDRAIADPTYDFATCGLTSQQGRPCQGTSIGGNCFLTWQCLKPGEKNSVIPGAVEMGLTLKKLGLGVGGLLFGSVVLWAVWTLIKNRKKR